MLLQDIFNDLVYGELSANGIATSGSILEDDKPKVIAHINIVLTALYTRFPLLSKELTIIQEDWITSYKLSSDHAMSNATSTEPKYIFDTTTDPFTNDVIRVTNVYDEAGCSLVGNTVNSWNCNAYYNPSSNVIEVPNPIDTNALFVVYQAKHPVVTLQTTELLLPDQFRPALLAYVASRIYSGGTSAEHVQASTMLMQKYEMFCVQLDQLGMVNANESFINEKMYINGWV